ncbi:MULTISPECIES: hypothetical protein [unclassified Mesorhizobium]|uniref:hypothetical protein n=1 Tax=unclassified Mesorhizobium TaxID=325217 RepID=UPI000FD47D1C|nr:MULTISPECIES: hypothetical protein [unclassified Mesorhizobium]RVB73023.1 hypothetical protein EN885_27125 [Mesorhizobium sp. M6A.T.Cr.TU.014.01.1.1]RWP82845.1 MAG: hypothetical protein EOR10_02135 [Mesorhizobium sp.]RWQ05860.1 MAG: hypothetical protein EOR91_14490 [Mesorhizobium sp.]RWQ11692.1 MAG: hypothetical protein EOR90_01710 [Mesorhizobium sp.]
MAFDRYVPLRSRSIAINEFNDRQTELNEHFWSFVVMTDNARYLAREAEKADAKTSTATLFHARGPNVSRIPQTVGLWLMANDALGNWLRLSALISAVAFHEAYISRIVRTALMSDPLCRFGASRDLDGTVLLKRGIEIDYEADQKLLTRNVWSTRAANFRRIFGATDTSVMFPIAKLEKMRELRNEFAHGFGRSLDVPEPSDLVDRLSGKISQPTLLSYLAVLSKSASAIDRYLMAKCIGSFEILHLYHVWKAANPAKTAQDFKKHLIGNGFPNANVPYCKGLISYYENV